MTRSSGPLVREVEFPRRAAGVWGPIMALVAAMMVTLMTAVAVTGHHPRRVRAEPPTRPLRIDHRVAPPTAVIVAAPSASCSQRVWRASPDGRAEQFEDCAAPVIAR